MTPLLLRETDVDAPWTVSELEGIPALVLQAEGPVLSACYMALELEDLHLKVVRSLSHPGERDTFVLYDGPLTHRVLLEAEMEPRMANLMKTAAAGEPWFLIVQYLTVDGNKHTVLWVTNGKLKTSSVAGPTGVSVIERWVCILENGSPGRVST